MPKSTSTLISFCGTAFHSPAPGQIEVLHDALICIAENGFIESIIRPSENNYTETKAQCEQNGQLIQLQPGQYLLPGFVDLHVHAPQWPQAGKALHLSLYDWLQNNTFPLEARYADMNFTQRIYPSLVDALLANGTTTAMYFATIHHEPSVYLAQVCQQKGQRALIGRVAMDDPEQCPDFYRDPSAQASIDGARQFIETIQQLAGNDTPLVHPVVTPRFIPTCSDHALTGLGELTQQYNCHVQTHCSESDWEHNHVMQRFGKHDAQALNDFGLLTRKTILAHSNFLSDEDMDTIRDAGAGIAHCTLSNFYFSNSIFPLRHAMDKGLHIGLATDISGGHSPSMFDSCRFAIAASRALEDGVNPALPAEQRGRPDSRIDFTEAFWLATAGGGEALDLPIGKFAPGYACDAILIDTNTSTSNVIVWPELDNAQDALQKILYNATRSNIIKTWVQGQLVHDRTTHEQ